MYRQESNPQESWHVSGKQQQDVSAYLNCLGIEKSEDPTLVYLKKLQRNHLLHIPFENLDIQYFKKIELRQDLFYKKVLLQKRGGYCYELNGLFCWLLIKEGFLVEMVSAKVFNAKGNPGPDFDHLALVVTIKNKRYLVDVGFGDFSARPLLIKPDIELNDDNGNFMIKESNHQTFVVIKRQGKHWVPQYIFSLKPHALSDFQGMNHFHQTSPDSLFTKRKICSIMTRKGRITLTNNRLIISENGKKSQQSFRTENEFNKLLEQYFGFRMD